MLEIFWGAPSLDLPTCTFCERCAFNKYVQDVHICKIMQTAAPSRGTMVVLRRIFALGASAACSHLNEIGSSGSLTTCACLQSSKQSLRSFLEAFCSLEFSTFSCWRWTSAGDARVPRRAFVLSLCASLSLFFQFSVVVFRFFLSAEGVSSYQTNFR